MFKRLNLLRLDDIFTCQCMSFYHKYVNNNVPLFCKSLFTCNATHHGYQTRHNMQLSIPYSHTSRARKSIRYHLSSLLRRSNMPQCVIEKVHTHSLNGFSLYLNVTCALQARFKLNKDPTSAIRKCNLSSLLRN